MPPVRALVAAVSLALLVPAAASADRLVVPSGGPAAGFKSVQPDLPTQYGKELVAFNGFVYFAADDNVHGNELWRTNGTDGGTTLVADLYPGAAANSSNPHRFTVVGNRLYFNAQNAPAASSETVLYVDAPAPTTVIEAKAAPVGGGAAVTAAGSIFETVNGKALISRLQGETQNSNYAVYALGDSGTTFTKISSGSDDVNAGVVFSAAATVGGWTYYSRSNTNVSPGQGAELWRTDGATTQLVKDIYPNTANDNPGSGPRDFVATSDRVYFTADDGTHGRELWVSNPANTADTHIVHEHNANATGTSINFPGPVANGNILYYVPADDPGTGPEVWRTDGTEVGTRVVKDITPGTGGFSQPTLFPLRSGLGILRGADVFGSDGTDAGTALLATVGGDGTGPNNPLALGDTAYFVAGASPFGQAVWRTDGTYDGTFPLTAAGFDGASARSGCPCAQSFAVLGSRVLFFGRDPSTNETGYVKLHVIDRGQADELRTATTLPSITVAPDGARLDVSDGVWSGRPTEYTYQWLRNGQPIERATGSSYSPTAADSGQRVSARVSTIGIGAPRVASADSAAVTVGGGPAVTPTPGPGATPAPALSVKRAPRLRGKAKVGGKLKLTLPKFAQPGVKLSFKWYANGKRIRKQAKSSLKLSRKLKGKKVSVKITAKKAGFKTLTLTVKLPGKVKGR